MIASLTFLNYASSIITIIVFTVLTLSPFWMEQLSYIHMSRVMCQIYVLRNSTRKINKCKKLMSGIYTEF